jgi:hypothetical protein
MSGRNLRLRGSTLLWFCVAGSAFAAAVGCGSDSDAGSNPGLGAGGTEASQGGGSGASLNLGGTSNSGGQAGEGASSGSGGKGNPPVDQCGGEPCADHMGSESFVEEGAPDDAADTFDDADSHEPGTDALREPLIIYPSHETMFPINVSRIRHEWASGDNDLFELTFEGANTTVRIYTTQSNWEPSEEQWDWIAESNRGGEVQFTVRGLDSENPADAFATSPITLYFSEAEVEGAIYYWSTGTEGVMKALVSDPIPVKFYTDPAADDAGTCVACHTLSRDGKRLAVGYGGEKLREVSVPERATLVPSQDQAARNSGWTTFSPDGELLLVAAGGVLTLIDSDTGEPVGPDNGIVPLPEGQRATHPDWSALGDKVAIALAPKVGNKDVQNASIAILPYDDGTWGDVEVIIPSAGEGDNNFFPVWSPDSRYLAYVNAQEASKDAPTARLRLLDVDDNSITELVRLNERVNNQDETLDIGNSMPTWAPSTKPGIFWLAFSSLRAYATVRPQDGNEDQIWIAAIDPTKTDPSYSGFWAPFQNIDAGNHRAFWTHTEEDSQCLCNEVCGDRFDNDCDGDADESECVTECGTVEICDDGIDNNCDCVVDDCQIEDCDDGQDNDDDGLADDEDPDCKPQCEPSENCGDGKDNDCDGLTDDRDPECVK